MIQSAAAAGAGKTPAGIQRLIKDLTEPKMNWRELIRMNIQSIVRNDYAFTRPNRKGMHSGAILPGLKQDETIDVAVALDMSGSIGQEDAMIFLSEIKGIMDQYADYNIHLWCFDTDTYNPQKITQDNGEELLEYKLMGGGGTDFEVNWSFMKDNDIVPKKFIMFTDGYPCGSWGDEDYCDTLFIVKGGNNISPFGQTVLYDEKV
jgi:predicted metal-dependent peptidase